MVRVLSPQHFARGPATRDPGLRVSPDAFGAGVGREIAQLGQAAADLGFRFVQAERSDQLAKANIEAAKALKEEEARLLDDREFGTQRQRFNDFAEQEGNRLAATIPHAATRTKFLNDFARQRIAVGINVGSNARKRIVGRRQAGLDENLNGLVDLVKRSKNPLEREDHLTRGLVDIDIAVNEGVIPAKDGAKMKEKFRDDAERDAQAEDALSTARALGLEEGLKFLTKPENTHLLKRSERNELVEAFQRDLRLKKEADDKARKAFIEQTRNDFLTKSHTDNLLPLDVLKSSLPPVGPGSKKTFLDIIDKRLDDAEKDREDSTKTSDPALFTTMLVEANDGKITDPDLPLTLIGRGADGKLRLGTVDAEKIRQAVITSRKPIQDHRDELKNRAIKSGIGEITGGTIAGVTPAKERRARGFVDALEDALKEGEEAGRSIADMLTPGRKDYIVGDLIAEFKGLLADGAGGAMPTGGEGTIEGSDDGRIVTGRARDNTLTGGTGDDTLNGGEDRLEDAGESGVSGGDEVAPGQNISLPPGMTEDELIQRIEAFSEEVQNLALGETDGRERGEKAPGLDAADADGSPLIGPGGEGQPDEKPGKPRPPAVTNAGPPTNKPVVLHDMYKKLRFDPKGINQKTAFFNDPIPGAIALFLVPVADLLAKFKRNNGDFGTGTTKTLDLKQDAFRHTYWSYLVTQLLAADLAKGFGDAHEISTPNPPGGRLMDLYNNNAGRKLALDPANKGRPADEVILDALRQGQLQTRPFAIKSP